MRDRSYPFPPEVFKRCVIGAEGIFSNHPAADFSFSVIDDHPVAAKIPADLWSRRIYCAMIPCTLMTLTQEPADFFPFTARCITLNGKFIGNLLAVFRINMGKKERVVNFTATIIVLVVQLAFYRHEGTKTHAAFPAQIANEFRHTFHESIIPGEKELRSVVTLAGWQRVGEYSVEYDKKFDFSEFSEKYKYLEIHTGMRTCMAKKNSNCGCSPQDGDFKCSPASGFRVEAVLSVDERGQMVVPKDIREKALIKTGDKLALISWEKNGSICCLALIKVENLSGMVKDVLGPLMHDIDS